MSRSLKYEIPGVDPRVPLSDVAEKGWGSIFASTPTHRTSPRDDAEGYERTPRRVLEIGFGRGEFLLAADEDRESLHGHLVARAHGKGARASERYVRNFQEIFKIQEDLLERAETFSVPVVDVQNLEGASRRVVKHVVGKLGERRAAEAAGLD